MDEDPRNTNATVLYSTNNSLASQPSHYPDVEGRADTGTPIDPDGVPFSPERPQKKLAISNLTRNLMSSGTSSSHLLGILAAQTATPEPSFSRQPPSYSASATPHNNFIPAGLFGSHNSHLASVSSSYSHGLAYAGGNASIPQFTPPTGNMHYIPLGHNTPTIVSSSYTSNHSFTPSYSVPQAQGNEGLPQTQAQTQAASVIMMPNTYQIPSGPTTNVSMDSSHSHFSVNDRGSYNRDSISSASSNYARGTQGAYIQSLPNSFAESSSLTGHSSQQTLQRVPSDRCSQQQLPDQMKLNQAHGVHHVSSDFLAGPDHYMSYNEYLQSLNQRDLDTRDGEQSGYEEHLNIVEYPVDQLITMLACLLTKIIEANDKLHPNHFDTTIAARQKVKEQRKIKKMEREQKRNPNRESTSFTQDGINTTVSHIAEEDNSEDSDDDEEDDVKNKYLANVLAFHGTNVPGITLHAYLTRVLKYCPVTNEVFLSLLVYFDRIAKSANNFQQKKHTPGNESAEEAEQIFVMDSFNIHRLIILGITVSSKFFSDIFYKNLRYAKVGGLPLEELNYLELQFLLLLDFKLMISVEDLQNYGDLLLKFWKREQLASDMVSGSTLNTESSGQKQGS